MKFPSRKVFSRGSLQKSLALQPVYLGASVSPDYIRLLILEIPGNDDNHVTLSDPDPLLHLAWYAGHPGNAVDAPHLYAIGAKQAFHMTEYLSILFAGETNSSDYSSFFFPPLTTFIQLITSNNNYGHKINDIFEAPCLEQPKHLSCALALKTTLK
jgi:hypothetical protein